jgi:hypothetical protein
MDTKVIYETLLRKLKIEQREFHPIQKRALK